MPLDLVRRAHLTLAQSQWQHRPPEVSCFHLPLQCSRFLPASFRELVVGSDDQSGVTPDGFGGHVLAYVVVVAACQFEPTVSLDEVVDVDIHL